MVCNVYRNHLLLLDLCYTESPVCKMNVAVFSSSPLLPQSLVCNWPAVGHTLVLAVCRSGHLCSICSAVWSSRPQSQIGDGASFIFLNMWALSRLCPVCSLMTTSYCHRSRKWKSSLSVRCPRAALMRVIGSWKVTLSAGGRPSQSVAPSLASSSAFSLSEGPQWDGDPCTTAGLCCPTS